MEAQASQRGKFLPKLETLRDAKNAKIKVKDSPRKKDSKVAKLVNL